jgi:outer membrane protein assembly factor BamD
MFQPLLLPAVSSVGRSFGQPLRRSAIILMAFLLPVIATAGGGCATSDDATKPITYSSTAKQNYEKGLAELKDENYPEALKYFQFVRSKSPFSKYAVLAELAIADTQFDRGNYTEAADSYKQFIRLHPTNDRVTDGYAAFRVGECAYKDMPDDVWLLPPSYEKDQSAVGDTLRELDDFVKKYPDSPYVEKAQPLRREALKRLVDHEVYVARFYLDRDRPKAAAMRIEGAIRRYPGSGREPELLMTLGQTYLHMGDPARARDTFERVVREYRDAEQARRSELYLDFIRKRYGDHPTDAAPEAGHGPQAGHG